MKSIFKSQIFWLAIVNLIAVVINFFFPDIVIDADTQQEIVMLPWASGFMNAILGLLLIAARFITVSPVKGVAPDYLQVPVSYSTDFTKKLSIVAFGRPILNILVSLFAVACVGIPLSRLFGWIGWGVAAIAGITIFLLLRKESPDYESEVRV